MASAFKRGGIWYARFRGVNGWDKQAVGRDKAGAEQMAGALEMDAKWRRAGLVDPKADAFAAAEKRPLTEHLEDFRKDILARRGNENYATQTHQRAARLLAGVESLSEIAPVGVNEAVRLLREGREAGEGIAAVKAQSKASIAHHLRAVKSFTRWLVRNGRTRDDALITLQVSRTVAKSERVRTRRAISADEFERLVTHTAKAGALEGMNGADRAMLYRLAGATGFRQGELRSLTRESFDLSADEPSITVRAAYSKRRRDDRQPIAADLAAVVKPWLATKPKAGAVFGLPRRTKIAAMLRTDATAARDAWIGEAQGKAREKRAESTFLASADASGAVLDFHGLRVSYISWLVESGASVKTCMELARHSSPMMTIGVYARMSLQDQGRALAGVPVVGTKPPADEAAEMRATGTYGDSSIGTRVGQTQANLGKLRMTQDDRAGDDEGGKKPPESSGKTLDLPVSMSHNAGRARVAELADAQDLGSCAGVAQVAGNKGLTKNEPSDGTRVGQTMGQTDPDLALLAGAWPTLPAALKAGILAMVKAAKA